MLMFNCLSTVLFVEVKLKEEGKACGALNYFNLLL